MPNTKPNNYQEMKKTVCRNFLKDGCPYGKGCKFRHPKVQEEKKRVCTYFLQNKCKRGAECPFLHDKPKAEKPQRQDWLTFCLYYPNRQCKNKECRFLHITEEEKDAFRRSGKVGSALVEQAMCKALLQDVSLDGITSLCKDHLQGCCEWMSCPLLHLNRREYCNAIVDMLREKFEAVLGVSDSYHAVSKSAYESSFAHQKTPGHSRHLNNREDRYPPIEGQFYDGREDDYCNDNSNWMNYKKMPKWHGVQNDHRRDYNEPDAVSPETERIIEGVYNLMKRDTAHFRNPEHGNTDLRMKLNRLSEDNARYHYELNGIHDPQTFTGPNTDDYKYQDVLRRLEKENREMKRQLDALQKRDQNCYTGAYDMQQGGMVRGKGKGQPHHAYDKKMYGLPKLESSHGHPFNTVKQKVNSRLQYNMHTQYKIPQQVHYGAYQHGKVNPKKGKFGQGTKNKTQKKKLPDVKASFSQKKSVNISKNSSEEECLDEESANGDAKECTPVQTTEGLSENLEVKSQEPEGGNRVEEEEEEVDEVEETTILNDIDDQELEEEEEEKEEYSEVSEGQKDMVNEAISSSPDIRNESVISNEEKKIADSKEVLSEDEDGIKVEDTIDESMKELDSKNSEVKGE